jgi:integrase
MLAAAKDPLRSIIPAGIYAGLRIESEALTLGVAEVDLRRDLLAVQAAYAKSGKTRTIPLNRTLRAAFATLKDKTPGAYLFARGDGSPYRSIRTACRHAGLKGVTPHVLRHTFTSRLGRAGVDLRTVQELGGWSSLDLVQR